MTTDQLTKLPKWAQEHIRKIERERNVAIRALNEWTDNQTPSKVKIREMECLGEEKGPYTKTRFVQTERVEFDHDGIHLEVSILNEGKIELQWSKENRRSGEIAMIPESFQRVRLVADLNQG